MSNKNTLARTTPAADSTEIVVIAESKWDEARKFIDASGRFERCKLFAQAMAGMHLRDIQRELGLGHGGARRVSSGQIGHLKFGSLVEEKMGLSVRTATRLMEMGDQLRKRLKKLPELSGVEVDRAAIGDLSESQLRALEAGVRRLTDDRTQQQLLAELGLYKAGHSLAPGGARGEGGPRLLTTPESAAAAARDIATRDWSAIELMLRGYADKFLVLQDNEIEAQTAALEIAIEARKKWVAAPRAKRNPAGLSEWMTAMLTGRSLS